MKRREFLRMAGGLAAGDVVLRDLIGQTRSGNPPAKKPNIIFVLADDLGIGDVSSYGADNFKTPNIDQLARGGVRFSNAYTAPLCGPSRACILTGRYAFRTGATNQDATGRMQPSVEIMTPTILKPAGYVTASIGKWGQLPLGPAEFGFDEHLKFTGSGVYWNTQAKGRKYTVNGTVKNLGEKEYLPDIMHDYLVDFMTRHRANPFYAYYSMSHVHAEILPTPDSAPDSDLYADNITYMDKLVGKLVADLDRLKLRDNTMLVFVGDNGTAGGYAGRSTINGQRLSGQKGSMLEGGARVPLIVNWPGRTPAGKVSADLVDATDFQATFAEVAGAKLPAGTVFDGHSIAPQLQGQKGKPRDWIFIQLAGQWYVRDAAWKLNQAGELFDMSNSPFDEPLVPADRQTPAAIAARKKLQAALDALNPAGGILDDGDGSGRHEGRKDNRQEKKKKR